MRSHEAKWLSWFLGVTRGCLLKRNEVSFAQTKTHEMNLSLGKICGLRGVLTRRLEVLYYWPRVSKCLKAYSIEVEVLTGLLCANE